MGTSYGVRVSDLPAGTDARELALEIERALGADVVMALDEYPPGGATREQALEANRRTLAWLSRCRQRFAELESDPAETARLLAKGAEKARDIAAATLARAKTNIGLLES